jgi:site-specific DNA-methyltransferase (adenine-specific)
MLERTDIVYIKHFDNASTIFGSSVSIEGGVNYFLKDTNHNGDCMYNGYMTKLNKYDVFVDSKFYNIIDKMLKFNSIDKIFIGQSYSGVNSNDKRLKDTETKTTIKCYVSQQKGFEKYIEKNEINKDRDFNKWKVITARANGGNKCFGNMFIGKPNEICNQSYVLFEIVNEEEAKSLLTYMKCRLPNFMLSLRKASQDICESTCKWIPLPPLNKEWTDEEVYKHFNLLEEDIKLINDTNIAGYKNIVKQPTIIVENEVMEIEVKPKVKKLSIVKPKKL